jgi:hypothetical protein
MVVLGVIYELGPPTPSRNQGEGTHSLAGEGGGPNSDVFLMEKKLNTLSTLWVYPTIVLGIFAQGTFM